MVVRLAGCADLEVQLLQASPSLSLSDSSEGLSISHSALMGADNVTYCVEQLGTGTCVVTIVVQGNAGRDSRIVCDVHFLSRPITLDLLGPSQAVTMHFSYFVVPCNRANCGKADWHVRNKRRGPF